MQVDLYNGHKTVVVVVVEKSLVHCVLYNNLSSFLYRYYICSCLFQYDAL